MVNELQNIDIRAVNNIAVKAGEAIMEIYGSDDFNVEYKSDLSPLTIADKTSHYIIKQELEKLYPSIPVLSEEGKTIPYEERKNWNTFWLVDPLDGTKEFIKRNGEFTVNIALIENRNPVLGVIYIPVKDTLYYGDIKSGAFKMKGEENPEEITVKELNSEQIIAVKSRSHSSDYEDEVLSMFNVNDSISVGSSVKFCWVAEGKADLYFRNGPTWEWDTAAGHAIVVAARGHVKSINNEVFMYNKKDLLNSSFIASSINPDITIGRINDLKKIDETNKVA